MVNIVLAGAWQPRGELARLKRYYERLKPLYSHIVVALKSGEPDEAEIRTWFHSQGIRYQLYDGWSGRHTVLKLALEANADFIHYVDMDRLVRWVELYPDELKHTVERIPLHDLLLIGRTSGAYVTHSRTLIETEALPNRFFSFWLGSASVMDLSAGSRGFSRRAAELVLKHSSDVNALAMDIAWTVLIHRAKLNWDYIEVNGLDWETADRFQDRAANANQQRDLAAEHDNDPSHWELRVRIAQEMTELGIAAIQQDL